MIDDLVPKDHLLRKIDRYIDFSFINEICRPYYCADNGRPAIEPEILFRMLFLGYLYGIRSERRLVEEVKVNVAYRWFLGYTQEDKIPDASVIWQNRIRRFNGTDIPEKIFNGILRQAISHGLVEGKVLYSDSTHLKANANKKKYAEEKISTESQDYISDLNKAINADRIAHGKKPLCFEEERTVDKKYNIITDTFVTPGNVNDVKPYIERLKYQIGKWGFDVRVAGLDAGYNTAAICKQIYELGIEAAMGTRRGCHQKGKYGKYKYTYLPEWDICICPERSCLQYTTTNRQGYREYKCSNDRCVNCPGREQCLSAKQTTKTIRRHVWEDYKDKAWTFTYTEYGKRIYSRRKETIGRGFADAKELHGLRYCRMRGIAKVSGQCFLTAAVQNMKKIATILSSRSAPSLFTLYILKPTFSLKKVGLSVG